MVDFFLVLLLPAGGDELQGIKKGVVELADALVVNKADGATRDVAERTRVEYAGALDLIRPGDDGWRPRALIASAIEGSGVDEVWEAIEEHRALIEISGTLARRRREQSRAWMWKLVDEGVANAFRSQSGMAEAIALEEAAVEAQKTTPSAAARTLLARFLAARRDEN